MNPVSSTPSAASLPNFESLFRPTLPTLHHVPKGARNAWASLVSNLCSDISRDPFCVSTWIKFFMLPRCVLGNPARGGRSNWRNTLRLIKSRIRRWKADEVCDLWNEMLAENAKYTHRFHSRKASAESIRKSKVLRAKRAIEDGQLSKALKMLSSEGLAPPSHKVVDDMIAKHPQSAPPSLPSGPASPPPSIPETLVLGAVRSFPAGSAPGPSGLRPSHLKEAVLCPSPVYAAQATRSLTDVVRTLSAGEIPSKVVPHLCGAHLLAARKKSGGLRPIAVGEVLRRLTSKCLSRAVHPDAVRTLSPLQLGVSVRGGCEAIVHSVSRVVDEGLPNRWVLLLDFSNAFNSIDRSTMFREIRDRIPSLAPWMECCYGARPELRLGEVIIPSCCGVQQGDPLGPLGFSLALQPLVESIRSNVPGLKINVWYLDDGTLCGSPADLALALQIIERDGPSHGLHLNRSKSLLYVPESGDVSANPLPSDIPVAREGFSLLGCPIGPPVFCHSVLSNRVMKVREVLERLPDLQDSQMEVTLLRQCLSFPKFAFSLRSCPPKLSRDAASSLDGFVRDALSDMVGGPVSDWSWLKASLPVSKGGLGLRWSALHAHAAYVSSIVETLPLVSKVLSSDSLPAGFDLSIHSLAEAAHRSDWVSLESIDIPIHQRSLSKCIDDVSFNHLLSSAPDSRSRALVLSSSLPHAGDWLSVVPSLALGLHLQDREFRPCLQYWLGLPIYADDGNCPVCLRPADCLGDHQVGCGGASDRIARHNYICDSLLSAARSAALAPRKEMPSLIPGSRSRPADIYLPNWFRGNPAALDVTVISTMQPLTLKGAASISGYALGVAEERKIAAHAEDCQAAGVQFIPLVLETVGGWGRDLMEIVNSFGRLQAQRLGSEPAEAIRHLAQRVSISLWRGNAALWSARQPSVPALVDGLL